MKTNPLKGNLTLDLGGFALNSGEFELPMSGVTVLFGRSGSGKSTLLRAISGLDKRTHGQLSFANTVWQAGKQHRPTAERDIGFVFQDAALFPHLSVRQNLDYGIKRLPKGKPPADFNQIVERVGVAHLLDRDIAFLSGGERQRVAIARALLMQPKLLCMDEPLSALDWRAKAELLTLIEELVESLQLPVLYITHDPMEVERLADQVVLMADGRIQSVEPLTQLLNRADSPLFDHQGAVSVLQTHPLESGGVSQVRVADQTLSLPGSRATKGARPSQRQLSRVRILARDVTLALEDPHKISTSNHLVATVAELIDQDDYSLLVRLKLADEQTFFAEVTHDSAQRLQLSPGLVVFALIKTVALNR
ncbi:MAG: molybdenum ABC transporter ATP-binding protein [Hydrogenovibrio sp.]|uniref:molybdenum ABC transporter ATP-binding protein n=1 Tax=Hydrogenovibrio sp. TaxID=2065821 RepID=UPI00286FFEAB|nr:molybdenum ABC transporter ATP-binding protein [Hydrogenovibrio sp.]MDR9499400.1 molybdenum ABC transporter ATP-binding protein [Hydrogenovibrio sp.]